jgi:hypothetical protein
MSLLTDWVDKFQTNSVRNHFTTEQQSYFSHCVIFSSSVAEGLSSNSDKFTLISKISEDGLLHYMYFRFGFFSFPGIQKKRQFFVNSICFPPHTHTSTDRSHHHTYSTVATIRDAKNLPQA